MCRVPSSSASTSPPRTAKRPAPAAVVPSSPTRAIRSKSAWRELVAAGERGEAGALTSMLQRYPGHAPALTEFGAALVAPSSYEQEELTPATESIAARARVRALAAVFPPAHVSAAEAVG